MRAVRTDGPRLDDRTHVALVGELDLATQAQAHDEVLAAVAAHGGDVVLDLAGVTFVDARGVSALLRIRWSLRARGKDLELVGLRPQAVRLVGMLDADEALGVDDERAPT